MKEQHWKGRSNISIYQRDCLEAMKEMEDNAFDLAIVDPPYGIETKGNAQDRFRGNMQLKTVNDNKPDMEYFQELFRVSKNQIIWGYNWLSDMLPKCREFIFWYKHQPVVTFADGELAWTSFQKTARCFDLPFYEANKLNKGKIHPTQKPVKLYEWLLMNYATCKSCNNEGGYYEDVAGDGGSRMWQHCEDCDGKKPKILDTHLGSGSHALACWNLNFDLTAFELDADYFKATTRRIEKHTRQIQMF